MALQTQLLNCRLDKIDAWENVKVTDVPSHDINFVSVYSILISARFCWWWVVLGLVLLLVVTGVKQRKAQLHFNDDPRISESQIPSIKL